jgi:hypothetical protein
MRRILAALLGLATAALFAGHAGCATRERTEPETVLAPANATVQEARPGEAARRTGAEERRRRTARDARPGPGPAGPAAAGPPPAGPDPIAPRPDGSAWSHAGLSFEALRVGALGGRILHGSRPLYTAGDHEAYLAAFPRTPSVLVGGGLNLGDLRRSPAERVASLQERFEQFPGEMPFVSIWYTRMALDEARGGTGRQDGDGVGLDAEVLRGEFDADLALVAAMLRGFGRPAFVRIAPEFNTRENGYHREHFAASYSYIVDLFRRQGVDNAIYVWNYVPVSTPFPYLDWYPGDDVVDWWSADVFASAFEDPDVRHELIRFLADAEEHGMPVVLAECAPSTLDVDDPATWDRWFVPFFRLVNGRESIKAFLYSSVDLGPIVPGAGWRDVRLPGSAMAARYAAELAKPRYLHGTEDATR